MGDDELQGKNILKKEPMSKDVNDTDVFSFNDAFTSKLHKVKIGMVSAQKESEPEKTDTRHKARLQPIIICHPD